MISAELPEISKGMADKQGLTIPIIHDKGLAIARSFGLVFTLPADLEATYRGFGIDLPKNTGHPAWELPVPSRFVADVDGVIAGVDADPDYTVRPEPAATLALVRSIL